ncbi:MAG: hypothetical protein WCD15_21390, partial [Terriglobales bacterium]
MGDDVRDTVPKQKQGIVAEHGERAILAAEKHGSPSSTQPRVLSNPRRPYHTRQAFSATIGCPGLHLKA